MIDIHSHILPGMDDGAEDTQEMLEMARMAVSCGVTMMVATPHVNFPGVYDNYYDDSYIETFRWTETKLREAEIPLQLCMGMEVFVTPDVPELIRDKKLIPINNGHYMLVEFAFDEEPAYAQDMLQKEAQKFAEENSMPIQNAMSFYKTIQCWRRNGKNVVMFCRQTRAVLQAGLADAHATWRMNCWTTSYSVWLQVTATGNIREHRICWMPMKNYQSDIQKKY